MSQDSLTWVVSLGRVTVASSMEEIVRQATLLLAVDQLYPTAVSTLIGQITQLQFIRIARRS